jgi:hypothetical protein
MAFSMDELLAQMEADELEDKLSEQTKATPVEYGRLRGVAPQRVYYYLRTNKLGRQTCDCGRKVIDIDEADRLFKKGQYDANLRARTDDEDPVEAGDEDQEP